MNQILLSWLPKKQISEKQGLKDMAKNILITGATGLVGRKLVPLLLQQGHRVSILSRKLHDIKGAQVFLWDVKQQTIDLMAFEGIDTIVHLAGAGIADKKWTAEYKQEVIDSRVQSTQLLYQSIKAANAPVSSFISASAIGYYGDRGEEILTENSEPGTGFLANCCVLWEEAVNEGIAMGLRVVKIRVGLVLSREDGALATMEKPVRYFVGAPLGSGKQWMPWIHLDDMANIFAKAVNDNEMAGAYNGCSPVPVTNKLFTKSIAQQLGRPVWPIRVPAFVLKAVLGEMSIMPLMSSNTSAQKLLDAGYKFAYLNLDSALNEIYATK